MKKPKKFTLKLIEEALEKVIQKGNFYPKSPGGGLYKIGPGVISGRKGLELLDKTLQEQLKEDKTKLLEGYKPIKVADTAFGKIYFPEVKGLEEEKD